MRVGLGSRPWSSGGWVEQQLIHGVRHLTSQSYLSPSLTFHINLNTKIQIASSPNSDTSIHLPSTARRRRLPFHQFLHLLMANSTSLKSDAILEQMKLHLASGAGEELVKKVGLVYQINIAPKVPLSVYFLLNIRVFIGILIQLLRCRIAENWIQRGNIHCWSQERGSYQRLGSPIYHFVQSAISVVPYFRSVS